MTLEEVNALVAPYEAEDILETLRMSGIIEFFFIKGPSVRIWESTARRVDVAMFSEAIIESHREGLFKKSKRKGDSK